MVPSPSARRIGAALLPLGLLLGGCARGVLEPVGPVGGAQRIILLNSVFIMLCIIVPVIVATIAFAWWFRAGNSRAQRLPTWAFSGRIEVVTWSVPLMTIIFLGGIAWVGSHDLDPAKPLESKVKPLPIQVVALDWKWLFIYPDQNVALVNKLVVPVGTPLDMTLTSASVMNTFFVPQWGSMIYVMNGMADRLKLQADVEGHYHGLSGHFSGDGFSDMHFDAEAMSADAFAAWAAGAKAGNPTLDADAYKELSKQGLQPTPLTYGTVAPDLFADVVTQKLPPGPGPTPEASPKTPASRNTAASNDGT